MKTSEKERKERKEKEREGEVEGTSPQGISKGYPSPVFVNRDTRQLRGAVTVIGWVVFAGSMDQSKHLHALLSLSFSLTLFLSLLS